MNRLRLYSPIPIVVVALLFLLAGSCFLRTNAGAASTSMAESIWRNPNPSGPLPPQRDGHWMVDDATTGNVLLFGGKGNGSHYFNDLWAYAPASNKWREIHPTGVFPPGRFGHAMVYDTTNRTVLLFGGVLGTTNQPANDLWSYSTQTNTWTHLSPPGAAPSPRTYPSMVYDPARDEAILFGGWTGSNAFADTWVYKPSVNAWRKINTSPTPHARWGASMAFDSATNKLLLFGGLFGSYDGSSRLNDTWEYDPATNTWKNLNPVGPLPPARGYAAMDYDAAAERTILFGGFAGSDGLLADTWEYDPSASTWQQLDPGEINPAGRDFSAMVYNQASKTLVLFGGLTGKSGNVNGTVLNDTWRR